MILIQTKLHSYFMVIFMNSSNATPASGNTANFSEAKKIVLKDISAKWGKFSEDELGALKGKEDLVAQVVAKYSLDEAQAQRDVDTVLKGRQI